MAVVIMVVTMVAAQGREGTLIPLVDEERGDREKIKKKKSSRRSKSFRKFRFAVRGMEKMI